MKKYAAVMKRLRSQEEKAGVSYAKTDGVLYKTLSVLYTVTGAFATLMNIFFILSVIMIFDSASSKEEVTTALILVSICTAVIIAGYVLNRVKIFIPSGIMNVVPIAVLTVFYARLYSDISEPLGYKTLFFTRFLIPFVLTVIFIVWITVIGARAKHKTDKGYKKLLSNLYDIYNSAAEPEQKYGSWEEFLENYSPEIYKEQYGAEES